MTLGACKYRNFVWLHGYITNIYVMPFIQMVILNLNGVGSDTTECQRNLKSLIRRA